MSITTGVRDDDGENYLRRQLGSAMRNRAFQISEGTPPFSGMETDYCAGTWLNISSAPQTGVWHVAQNQFQCLLRRSEGNCEHEQQRIRLGVSDGVFTLKEV